MIDYTYFSASFQKQGFLIKNFKKSYLAVVNPLLPLNMASSNTLNFEGCNFFRQRLILATLSGKSVRISRIRHKDENPGIKGNAKSWRYLMTVKLILYKNDVF